MNTKETKQKIIQAGHKAIEELIKVAKEKIVDSDDDVSADRLKNAAATKKLAIMDAFEILSKIQEEEKFTAYICPKCKILNKLGDGSKCINVSTNLCTFDLENADEQEENQLEFVEITDKELK